MRSKIYKKPILFIQGPNKRKIEIDYLQSEDIHVRNLPGVALQSTALSTYVGALEHAVSFT